MNMYIDDFTRSNAKEVVALDRLTAGAIAWDYERIIKELGEPNVTGSVVYDDNRVIGAAIYHCGAKALHILHLVAIAGDFADVVKYIIEYLKSKLKRERIDITISVRETNLPLQLLLSTSEVGFKAFKVKRNGFIDTLEDAFLFRFTKTNLDEKDPVLEPKSSDFNNYN